MEKAASKTDLRPPVATIVIPTYNQRPEYLRAAVESVLAQTVPVEVLVVDDGSEPEVECFGGKVIRHRENLGISAALNTGIQNMTAEWFCWLSSDDMIIPEKIELQLAALKRSGCMASFHRYYVMGGGGQPTAATFPNWPSHKRQKQELGVGCLINGSTVMIHRSVFDDVGLFDESYKYGQDWEMWCRISRKYEWLGVNEFLGTRRTDGNLTELIARDEDMKRVRDAEDRRIRKQYGPA